MLKKYDKVIVFDSAINNFRTQHSKTKQLKIFTVEEVFLDGTFKLFQVGTYEKPIVFLADGSPNLRNYSFQSNTFKQWDKCFVNKKDK